MSSSAGSGSSGKERVCVGQLLLGYAVVTTSISPGCHNHKAFLAHLQLHCVSPSPDPGGDIAVFTVNQGP